ncbi:hypothetical protein KCP76_21885 [Salmonella enterica subsp. enterica serovar Weltevreden]|nr:hypothetical protein KCP76_21885 [Salmonella enterica subsp. enterica serovar Weltevreden]
MSQMDIGGALLAARSGARDEFANHRRTRGRMTFLRPSRLAMSLCCYARCVKRGTTSGQHHRWVKTVRNRLDGATRYGRCFVYVTVGPGRDLRLRVPGLSIPLAGGWYIHGWRRRLLFNHRQYGLGGR